MRTKKHYEGMLDKNPNTSIGFTLAADMVFTARHDVIHRAEDHGSDEWRNIAINLKRKYGETLTGDQVRHEMTPLKTAAAALGRVKSDRKSASSRENGKRGGRPRGRWMMYDTAERFEGSTRGLLAADSRNQAKSDGGAGVVEAPDGTRIYWEG